jgi:hypothetical protein
MLKSKNKLDIELFEYAKTLVAMRLELLRSLMPDTTLEKSDNLKLSLQCSDLPSQFAREYHHFFGASQPPGHKGP